MATSLQVRDVYARSDALRAASPALERVNAQARAAHGLATPDGTITRAELEQIINFYQLDADDLLLDVGCGTGVPAAFMLAQFGCRALGLDISAERLQAALPRVQQAHGRLTLAAADVSQPLPCAAERFAAVMQLDSIIHIEDKLALLREYARVLKRGGHLAICSTVGHALTPELTRAMGETPGTLFRVTTEQLIALVNEAGFDVLAWRPRNEELLRWHTARGELLQSAADEIRAEVGAAEFDKLMRRTTTLIRLLTTRVVESVLLLASRGS